MDPNENLYLDKSRPLLSWRKRLPHRSQEGKLVFITIRLGDSLPQTILKELKEKKERFERENPKPWSSETHNRYNKEIPYAEQKYLDAGYGNCIFRQERFRIILSGAIKYYDVDSYDVHAYVIMPNHLHLLVEEYEEKTLFNKLSSMLRYTSNQCNKLSGNRGGIWAKDTFDRHIRNREHYVAALDYIKNNPRHLLSGEYELYVAPFVR